MSVKKAFPLRISTSVLEAIQHWADDDLRSLNAQIEYVLREALRQSKRLPTNEREANNHD
jgi:hypothetical protein